MELVKCPRYPVSKFPVALLVHAFIVLELATREATPGRLPLLEVVRHNSFFPAYRWGYFVYTFSSPLNFGRVLPFS